MRIMGLDVGDVKIGVAVSDELGWTAQGITIVYRNRKISAWQHLGDLIAEYKVEEIVVGLPKNMDGSIGEQAEKTIDFAQTMRDTFQLPVSMWDERLSTVAASKTLLDADIRRSKHRYLLDKMAAVIILQGYLSSLQ